MENKPERTIPINGGVGAAIAGGIVRRMDVFRRQEREEGPGRESDGGEEEKGGGAPPTFRFSELLRHRSQDRILP